jgi:hypothetical protein
MNHMAALVKARNAIGSGDRAEMRRPPTVVRKPPLTARMTEAAASAAAIPRMMRLFSDEVLLARWPVGLTAYFLGIVQ